jgi:hypothetical protein
MPLHFLLVVFEKSEEQHNGADGKQIAYEQEKKREKPHG